MLSKPAPWSGEDCSLLWGEVRTTGAQFDGDRTDIHDVMSLIWGGILRSFGLSSVQLVDEDHGFSPEEIGARHLLFKQCPWDTTGDGFEIAQKAMNAWTAFAYHLLVDVFQWDRECMGLSKVRQMEPPIWADNVARFLRFPKDIIISRRTYPFWIYFASRACGVSIVRMPRNLVSSLREILKSFVPNITEGKENYAIFANGISNTIPYRVVLKAQKLLTLTGDKCGKVIKLPIESHCLFIGDKTIIAFRCDCGRDIFEIERKLAINRRDDENRVFFIDSIVQWRTPLCPSDFEEMCVDLLRREPGVIRANPIGTTNDRDGGRDIIIKRKVPNLHQSEMSKTTSDKTLGTRTLSIIVQVKSRSRTIGKSDVQDIRDILEHNEADGFMLIAHPRISAPLVDHLDKLRNKYSPYTDWWEVRDIEDRLRHHPDIAKRYPNLVTLLATE